MEALLQALASPGEMSSQQWLLVAILVFVVIGAAYMVWRLYTQRERENRNGSD
jgi:hypothetical protein